MDLQYLFDSDGKRTAVVIDILEWENLTLRYEELKKLESSKKKPSDFRGTISQKTVELLHQHTEQARKEWDRNIF
jgi:hypothetical protein